MPLTKSMTIFSHSLPLQLFLRLLTWQMSKEELTACMHACLSYQPTKNHPILKPFPTASSSPNSYKQAHSDRSFSFNMNKDSLTNSAPEGSTLIQEDWVFAKFRSVKTSFWRRTRLSIIYQFTHSPGRPRSSVIPLPHFLSSQQGVPRHVAYNKQEL